MLPRETFYVIYVHVGICIFGWGTASTQRFFPSLIKWYRKTDQFTIRNGPSQFPNGPFHNWTKISHYESKHCNNVLKSAFFAHKLPFYRYYCLLPVCIKPVHQRTGKILVPDRIPAPRTLNVKRLQSFDILICQSFDIKA